MDLNAPSFGGLAAWALFLTSLLGAGALSRARRQPKAIAAA